MSWEELLEQAAGIYRDYNSELGLEDDVKELLERFLLTHFNDYLCILPYSCIKEFVVEQTQKTPLTVNKIDYKGGRIVLSDLTAPYLKLISFKHKEWQTKLYSEDLIDANSPTRKLQNDEDTCGKTAKPVICIEYVNQKKSLCFWGYKNSINSIEDFTYLKKVENKEEFLKLEDYILTAYIYYCLYFLFNTQKEIEMSQVVIEQMKQLLSIHNIEPTQPIIFNNEKKK